MVGVVVMGCDDDGMWCTWGGIGLGLEWDGVGWDGVGRGEEGVGWIGVRVGRSHDCVEKGCVRQWVRHLQQKGSEQQVDTGLAQAGDGSEIGGDLGNPVGVEEMRKR